MQRFSHLAAQATRTSLRARVPPGANGLGGRLRRPEDGQAAPLGWRKAAIGLGRRLVGLAGLHGLAAGVRGLGHGLGRLGGGGGLERLAWFGAGLSAGSAAWLVGEVALGPLRAQPSAPPRPTLAPLRVQVDGEVEQPGVYAVAPGARVEDALRAAGGTTPGADPGGLNLVARVADGQRIAVPARTAARASASVTPAVRARAQPTRTPAPPRRPTPTPAARTRLGTPTPAAEARLVTATPAAETRLPRPTPSAEARSPPPTEAPSGWEPHAAMASPW